VCARTVVRNSLRYPLMKIRIHENRDGKQGRLSQTRLIKAKGRFIHDQKRSAISEIAMVTAILASDLSQS